MQPKMRQQRDTNCRQVCGKHSSTLVEKAKVITAAAGPYTVILRAMNGHGQRADKQQPLATQRHCRTACQAYSGTTGKYSALRTAKENGAPIPTACVTGD